MSAAFYLIPISLILGLAALVGFFWTLRNGQYNDPEGDAHRILNDDTDRPLGDRERRHLR